MQTSNHVSLSITTVIIIHRQRSLMVIIIRTRKDSCTNARPWWQSRCTVRCSRRPL